MQTVDSNVEQGVKVPRQVAERAQRARDMLKPESDPQEPVNEPALSAPVAQVVAAPDFPSDVSLLEAASDKENDPVYWRYRASVINGLWKADKKRLDATITQLREGMAVLKTDVAKLQAAKPVDDQEVDLTAFFSSEQIEQFGEEQCRVMARTSTIAAKKAAQEQIKEAVEPLHKSRREDAEESQKRKGQDLLEKLTEIMPNWRAINADDRWKLWLTQDDPETGLERQELLSRAEERFDAKRIAEMLNKFLLTLGTPMAISNNPPHLPSGGAAGVEGNNSLPVNMRFPTRKEIREFYTGAALGKVTAEARKEFDQRVAAAQAAGAL